MAGKETPRASARERLLQAASELFYEEGVNTVGIDRVIERAGVAKASLYNTFGSKDELIHAYLKSRQDRIAAYIQAAVDAAAEDLGLATRHMYSAAGHDAQNLAQITDAGMIFIPSKGGKSHRTDEMSDWDAIERGANVLLRSLLALAR